MGYGYKKMTTIKKTYNIPGSGNITALLFNHTTSLINFLDKYGHIDRLREINQLGRLRDIYPGAHHNRYEYVFLQWSLVAEIAKQKGNNHGFSTPRKFFGKINDFDKYPSTAEILQCLILLTNIGYCDGTFATNIAWLNNLKTHKKNCNIFKNGLDKRDIPILEKILDEFDFYNLHIIFALFLLQRYKRTSNGHIEFSSELLRKYYYKDSSNVHLTKIWDVFQNVRKISFLTLDSLYAPVPFSLRLTSIVLSFTQYYEEIFIKKSAYKSAIDELEKVLQNSVYLSGDSILNTNKAASEINTFLESKNNQINCLKDLFFNINCKSKLETKWKKHNEPDWNRDQNMYLEFENTNGFLPNDYLKNPLQWENTFQNKIGTTKTRIGALTNPSKSNLKISTAINDTDLNQRLRTTLKVSKELIKFMNLFDTNYINPKDEENKQTIFISILKSIFGWDKRFILQAHDNRFSAFVIENGKNKSLKMIDKYIENVKGLISQDQLLEIQETRDALDKYGYSGLSLVYLGATKIFSAKQNNESAEFDGFIIFPTRDLNDEFFYIVEAKNIVNGFTESQKQLQKRTRTITPKEFDWVVDKLSKKAAIGKFKLK